MEKHNPNYLAKLDVFGTASSNIVLVLKSRMNDFFKKSITLSESNGGSIVWLFKKKPTFNVTRF